jgi:hypothetical protein
MMQLLTGFVYLFLERQKYSVQIIDDQTMTFQFPLIYYSSTQHMLFFLLMETTVIITISTTS